MIGIDRINSDIATLRQMADIVFQESETMMYLGFCRKGITETGEKGWNILRIRTYAPHGDYPIITDFMWAQGSGSFGLIFDDFLTYDYYFHKF